MSAILLYHRVAALTSDPWALAVSRHHFAEHLDALRRHARVMDLSTMLRLKVERRLPDNAVAITFDDGYADNILHARPLLESRGVPATFFVVSGSIGQNREFWWDELERLLLQPGDVPDVLNLEVNGKHLFWHLSPEVRLTAEDVLRHSPWRVGMPPPTLRHRLYHELWKELLDAKADERERVLDQVRDWAGADARPRALNLPFSVEQVRQLAASPLCDIGAHTVTHPRLPALPLAEQARELDDSRMALHAIIGRPVDHFSYPFGMYTEDTMALAREAGYVSACIVDGGPVRSDTDPHALPRLLVQDWDAGELLHRLSGTVTARRTSPVISRVKTVFSRRRHHNRPALRIPKVFHRVWLGPKPMPQEFVTFGESWRRQHPGWEMRLWTDTNLPPLINRREFELAKNAAQKGDILKYELVYRQGGVYLDTDVECLRNIEPLLSGVNAFAAWESQECVNVALFGAVGGHPALEQVIAALPESFKREQEGRQDLSTGPGLFTSVVGDHGDLVLFGPELFYPYHFTEKHRRYESFAGAYAVHHWAYSWAPEPSLT